MSITVLAGTPPTTDITPSILAATLRYENSGGPALATATFEAVDMAAGETFTEEGGTLGDYGPGDFMLGGGGTTTSGDLDVLVPEAEVQVLDGATVLVGGMIRDRTRTSEANGALRKYSIGVQDYTSLLTDDVIDDLTPRTTVESDKVRIEYLLTTYGTKSVTTGATVQTIEVAMPEQTFTGMTLYEAIADVCGLTGGQFYVGSDKALHYFASEAYPAPWNFSDTPDDVTTFGYSSLVLPDDTVELVNAVFVVGTDVSDWVTDPASIGIYGRHEGTLRDTNVLTADHVTAAGTAYLAEHAYPRQAATITTIKPGLLAGMTITVTNALWSLAAVPFRIAKVVGTVVSNEDFSYEIQLTDGVIDIGTLLRKGDSDATRKVLRSTNVAMDYALSLMGKVPVVAVLPTMPDAAWAGKLVMLTTDGKLYRCPDGTEWIRAIDGAAIIDGGDVLANSVTAGAIAAGAIGTSALAALAVTTEKLDLRDAYGSTILTSQGFGIAWWDYINNSVFNSMFSVATAVNPLPDGDNAELPFWTVSRVGSPTAKIVADAANYPGGYYVEVDFSATYQALILTQTDMVPFLAGDNFVTALHMTANAPTARHVDLDVQPYDSSGTEIGTWTTIGTHDIWGTWPTPSWRYVVGGSLNHRVRYVRFRVTLYTDDYYAAGDAIRLGGFRVMPHPDRFGPLYLEGDLNATSGRITSASDLRSTGLLITTQVNGAVSDSDFAGTATSGALGVDYANDRLYFRSGGTWRYINKTAGFEVPASEVICPCCGDPLRPGDAMVGRGDRTVSDGALHGLWIHLRCAERPLETGD